MKPIVFLLMVHVCQSALLHIKGGLIHGTTTTTRNGRKVYSYLGIPYALPPVNELRFQDPVPIKPWIGILNATKDAPECVQRKNLDLSQPLQVSGEEDCLYLNVYTPRTSLSNYSSGEKLAVMFFIYGGGWVTGSNNHKLYDPKYLLDRNVVLVVANYRLDSLGFLSTGNKMAAGNYGLKDQVAALKWVNQNIEYFGGDPDNVLFFGESVGGVSTNSIMYTPLAKGLFKRAASIAGTVDMPVAHQPVERAVNASKALAKAVGCPTDSSAKTLECLRKVPAKDLILKQTQLKFSSVDYPAFILMLWIPVYDFYISSNPYFSENPRTTKNKPTYEWMNGATTYDGTYFVCHIYAYPEFKAKLEEHPEVYLPELLLLSSYLPPEAVPIVMKRIIKFYFGSQRPNQVSLSKLFTDSYFFWPAVRTTLDFHAGPVHFFIYTYTTLETWNNVYGPFGVVTTEPGHTDPLLNLFESSLYFNRTADSEMNTKVSERLVNVFTSFAKNGDPTSGRAIKQWDIVQRGSNNFAYLNFSSEFVQMENPYPEVVAFWRSIDNDFPSMY